MVRRKLTLYERLASVFQEAEMERRDAIRRIINFRIKKAEAREIIKELEALGYLSATKRKIRKRPRKNR